MTSCQPNPNPASPLTKDVLRTAWGEERNGILSVIGSFDRVAVRELAQPLNLQSICMNYDSFYDAMRCRLHSNVSGPQLPDSTEPAELVSSVPLSANEYPLAKYNKVEDAFGNTQSVATQNKATLEAILKGTDTSPDEVHTLILAGPIPVGISVGLINKLKTLQNLYVHFGALDGLILKGIPLSVLVLELPLLQNFTVAATGIDEGVFSLREHTREFNPCLYLDFLSMFSLLNALLNQNHFVQLKSLVVDVPYCSERENTFVTAFGAFIARHRETLENLCYHQGFIVKCAPTAEELERRESEDKTDENGNDIVDDDHVSMTRLALNAIGLKPVRMLKNIHINLASQQESDPLWKNFILTQKVLERFIFTGDSRIPFPCHTLRDSGPTLTTVIVEIRDDVDLQCLQNCNLLRKLVIMGKPHQTEEIEIDFSPMNAQDDPNLFNVTKLPKSIETLSFRHMNIRTEDVDYLVLSKELPNLKEFELIGGGTRGDFGITCTTVALVWEARTLHRFGFKSSLNKKSLAEKAEIPKSFKFMAMILEENVSLADFKVFMRKNSSGQYVWDKRDEKVYNEWLSRSIFDFPETTRPGYEEGYVCYKDAQVTDEEDDDSSEYETISGATTEAEDTEAEESDDDDNDSSSSTEEA